MTIKERRETYINLLLDFHILHKVHRTHKHNYLSLAEPNKQGLDSDQGKADKSALVSGWKENNCTVHDYVLYIHIRHT